MADNKYFAWFKQQGEGCDYTIGCGEVLQLLEATTKAEAIKETNEILQDEDSSCQYIDPENDFCLEECYILKLEKEIDLEELQNNFEKNKEKEENDEEEQEYLRLKKKFEKKSK